MTLDWHLLGGNMKTNNEFEQFINQLGYSLKDVRISASGNLIVDCNIKLSDLLKLKDFLQIDDFELDGTLSTWQLVCSPIETGELKLKKEEYEKGYSDGFNSKGYRPSSEWYMTGYNNGEFAKEWRNEQ